MIYFVNNALIIKKFVKNALIIIIFKIKLVIKNETPYKLKLQLLSMLIL